MTETAASRPTDALNEQDLEAVNAGLSLPGLAGAVVSGIMGGGVMPGAVTGIAQMLGVTGVSTGGIGPGPAVSPLALQGGCPVLLSSKSE